MQSGKYRHRVILLRRSDTQSAPGQVEFDYVEFARVRAKITPLSGREFFAAQQVQSEASVRISIRWRKDVDETCRIRHETDHSVSPALYDEYDIVGPPLADDKTGRRELMMMCSKRTAEGWRG